MPNERKPSVKRMRPIIKGIVKRLQRIRNSENLIFLLEPFVEEPELFRNKILVSHNEFQYCIKFNLSALGIEMEIYRFENYIEVPFSIIEFLNNFMVSTDTIINGLKLFNYSIENIKVEPLDIFLLASDDISENPEILKEKLLTLQDRPCLQELLKYYIYINKVHPSSIILSKKSFTLPFKKEDTIELATYIITETFYEQLMLDDYLRKQISTYYSALLDDIL